MCCRLFEFVSSFLGIEEWEVFGWTEGKTYMRRECVGVSSSASVSQTWRIRQKEREVRRREVSAG